MTGGASIRSVSVTTTDDRALVGRAPFGIPDYALDFMDARRKFWAQSTMAETGIGTPGSNVFSFMIFPFVNPNDNFQPRSLDNYLLVQRLFDRLRDFPADKITGFTLVEGQDPYLRPHSNQEVYTHQWFIRSVSGDDSRSPERFKPPEFSKIDLPGEAGSRSMRIENQEAFQGVVGSNGKGFALVEHAGHGYTLTDNPFPKDTERFCALQALWDELYGDVCLRRGTSLTQPKGLFVAGVHLPVPLFSSLVRFEGRPGVHLDVVPPAVSPPTPKWTELSERERQDNSRAEQGLTATNGYFWCYMAHVGEPIIEGKTMAQQNVDFLRIPWEWNENPDNAGLEIRGSHYKKVMGPFARNNRDQYGDLEGKHEVPMFELYLRGRDPAIALPTRDPALADASGGARVYLPPRHTFGNYQEDFAPSPPRSLEEIKGWSQVVQGLAAAGFKPRDEPATAFDRLEEDLFLNRYGEGLVFLEYTEGQMHPGMRSMSDQRWEIVKRLIHWHNNHPFLDIEESHFFQTHNAEFLKPDILSNQRNFVFRVKDFDWEANPDRDSIVERTRKFKLPPPHSLGMMKSLHQNLDRNFDSWVGLEGSDGRGMALIEMIAPFPLGGVDQDPRKTNALFCQLGAFWMEQFWWRKVVCTEFVRRWAPHDRPAIKAESYSYTMILHFERRDTPEAMALDVPKEIARIRDPLTKLPWERVPLAS